MKKRLLVGMLILGTAFFVACSAKETDKGIANQNNSQTEENGKLFDALSDLKEDKADYVKNYICVKETLDSNNPENNEFTFAGADEIFTIKGFDNIYSFYGGIAEAEKNGEDVLIDTNGDIICSLEKYRYLHRIISYSDSFKVIDRESDLEGVIDRTGKEIVACIYDEITFPWKQDIMDYVIQAKKGDLTDVYTAEGILLVENCNIDEYGVNLDRTPTEKYGVVVISPDDGNTQYYAEKTGERILDFGDEWSGSGINPTAKTVSLVNTETNEHALFLINEDYTQWVKVEDYNAFGNYKCEKINDYWLFSSDRVNMLYNAQGQLVADFGMKTVIGQDLNGNIVYMGIGEDKCIIFDENAKEMKQFTDIGFHYGYREFFCASPIVNGEKSSVKNIYNYDGEIVFEDIDSAIYYTGRYLNADFGFIEDDIYIVTSMNGQKFAKTQDADSFVELSADEEYCGIYMGYPTFKNSSEYVIRDKALNEVGRVDINAYQHSLFGLYYMDKGDGVVDYYSYKGEFLAEGK